MGCLALAAVLSGQFDILEREEEGEADVVEIGGGDLAGVVLIDGAVEEGLGHHVEERGAGDGVVSTRAEASAMASMAALMMKFPMSLTTLAAPGVSPKSKTPWPMASKIGLTRALASAGPEVQIQSLRAAAASGRPKTGAAR